MTQKSIALQKIQLEKKPTLNEFLDGSKKAWTFMDNKAKEDSLDPKKEKVSSAVMFINAFKSMEQYLAFQAEQYEKLIEPLTDDGYRALLRSKTESMFNNALTMLDESKGLKANNEYYKKQLEERQREFDEAREDLEKRNATVKSEIAKKIIND